MAINYRCPKCKKDFNLDIRRCPGCNYPLAYSKKFRIIVSHKGKRVSRLFTGNLKDAKAEEIRLKQSLLDKKENETDENKDLTLKQVWELYFEWAKRNKKSWRDDLFRWDKHIGKKFGSKKLKSIKPIDVEKFITFIAKQKTPKGVCYKPATIRQYFILLKRLFNWAIQKELYTGPNPCNKVDPPKVRNERTDYLTQEDLRKLMKTLDGWWNQTASRIVKMALYTGMRCGEILSLKWEQVDMNNRFIFLPNPKGKPTKLPINDLAMVVLQEAKENMPYPDCPFVFPRRDGTQRKEFYHIWDRIRKKAGFKKKYRFHDLRHTYASYLASSGQVDIYTLQSLLNHRSTQMTQRYAHLIDDSLMKGSQVAVEVFGGLER